VTERWLVRVLTGDPVEKCEEGYTIEAIKVIRLARNCHREIL
jgi:hypothetical protein